MTRRSLNGRLTALEQHTGGTVDLDAEAAAYGEPLWGGPSGHRAYRRQDGDTFRLAVVGGPGPGVVYEVPGIRGEWLV